MTSLIDKDPPLRTKLPDFGDDIYNDPGPALPPEGMEEPEFPHEDELKPSTLPEYDPNDRVDHTSVVEGAVPFPAGSPPFINEMSPSIMDAIELHEQGFATGMDSLDYITPPAAPNNAHGGHAPLPLAPMPQAAAAAATSAQPSVPSTAPSNSAAVEAILAEAEKDFINQNTLVFEFGPFRALETRMRGFTDGVFSGAAEQLVTALVRRSFHDAVSTNANLAKPGNTKEGLLAQVKALQDVLTNLDSGVGPLLHKLENAGVDGAKQLLLGLTQAVTSEHAALKDKVKDLAPPTLGRMLFDSLRNTAHSLGDSQLVGNARQHRNAELTKSLRSLYEVGAELKANAGNAEWERGQGKASLKEVKTLSRRIEGLTKGVEDQVDGLALRKGFNDVNGMLKDAGTNASDEQHKKSLESMAKYIAELVKKLTDALGALFNRNAGAARNAPTAL
jgi:hypothetical protein